MRRMYSVQELTKIVHDVVGEYIEEGALDESIAGAVDDYLTEHPVDITALEGLDISVGSLDADGLVTGAEIIEKMSGYSVVVDEATANAEIDVIYAGACKNGNKLTLVLFASLTKLTGTATNIGALFTIPASVNAKLYPYEIGGYNYLDNYDIEGVQKDDFTRKKVGVSVEKYDSTRIKIQCSTANLEANEETYVRVEETFLLSDNLVGE